MSERPSFDYIEDSQPEEKTPVGARAGRILAITLITAGLVVGADVGITLAWKEPLSALVGSVKQSQVRGQLEDLDKKVRKEQKLDHPPEKDLSEKEVLEIAKERANTFEDEYLLQGDPIGQIVIPSIGVDYTVVQGTDQASLAKGPGHYEWTDLPGQGKTIGVAGHRTTYLAPFREIDKMQVGDEITLDTPYGDFTYEMTEERVVYPTESGVIQDLNYERLVLSACHPLYSAEQRYVVFARLVDIDLWPPQGKNKEKKGKEKATEESGESAVKVGALIVIVVILVGGGLFWRRYHRE